MPKNKPPKNRGNLQSASSPTPNSSHRNVTQVAVRSAPLPHPSELEAYEAVLQGAAERIFAMTESQSSHRQKMEFKALSIEGRNSLMGIITGGIIGIFGLLVAGYCISSGHDAAGGTIGSASLASLVGTFIYGTRQRRIEREQKYLASTKERR